MAHQNRSGLSKLGRFFYLCSYYIVRCLEEITSFYKGLTPGKTYTVYGTAMVKGTCAELYQNGIPITGMTEFIPTAVNGTVEVTFVVDTYQLQGMEIMCLRDCLQDL